MNHLNKRTYGQSILPDTMARKYFREIKKFIRFDNKGRRRQRLAKDNFVFICKQLESFVTNCLLNYVPDWMPKYRRAAFSNEK